MESFEEIKIIKEKIIKTDHVLQMYVEVKKKYAELAKKYKQSNDDNSILKLDHEMKSFQYLELSKQIEKLNADRDKFATDYISLKSSYDNQLNELVNLQVKYQTVCQDLDDYQKSESKNVPITDLCEPERKKRKYNKKQKVLEKCDESSVDGFSNDIVPMRNISLEDEMNIKIEVLDSRNNVEQQTFNNFEISFKQEEWGQGKNSHEGLIEELNKCREEKSVYMKNFEEREEKMRTEWETEKKRLKGVIEKLEENVQHEKSLSKNFLTKEIEMRKKWEKKEKILKAKIADLEVKLEKEKTLVKNFENQIYCMKSEWIDKEQRLKEEMKIMKERLEKEKSNSLRNFEADINSEWQEKEQNLKMKVLDLEEKIVSLQKLGQCRDNFTNTSNNDESVKDTSELKSLSTSSSQSDDADKLNQSEKQDTNKFIPIDEDTIDDETVMNILREMKIPSLMSPLHELNLEEELIDSKETTDQTATSEINSIPSSIIHDSKHENYTKDIILQLPTTQSEIVPILNNMNEIIVDNCTDSETPNHFDSISENDKLNHQIITKDSTEKTASDQINCNITSNIAGDKTDEVQNEHKDSEWSARYQISRRRKETKYRVLSKIKKARQKFWLELGETFNLNKKKKTLSDKQKRNTSDRNGLATVFADLVSQKLNNTRSRARSTNERNVLEINKMLLEKAKQENETKSLFKFDNIQMDLELSSCDETLSKENENRAETKENERNAPEYETHSSGVDTPNFIDSCYESIISNPPSIQSLSKDNMVENKKEHPEIEQCREESVPLEKCDNEKNNDISNKKALNDVKTSKIQTKPTFNEISSEQSNIVEITSPTDVLPEPPHSLNDTETQNKCSKTPNKKQTTTRKSGRKTKPKIASPTSSPVKRNKRMRKPVELPTQKYNLRKRTKTIIPSDSDEELAETDTLNEKWNIKTRPITMSSAPRVENALEIGNSPVDASTLQMESHTENTICSNSVKDKTLNNSQMNFSNESISLSTQEVHNISEIPENNDEVFCHGVSNNELSANETFHQEKIFSETKDKLSQEVYPVQIEGNNLGQEWPINDIIVPIHNISKSSNNSTEIEGNSFQMEKISMETELIPLPQELQDLTSCNTYLESDEETDADLCQDSDSENVNSSDTDEEEIIPNQDNSNGDCNILNSTYESFFEQAMTSTEISDIIGGPSVTDFSLLKSDNVPISNEALADGRSEIGTKTLEKEEESHMETSLECAEANSTTFNRISQQLQTHSNEKSSLTAYDNEEMDHSEEKSSSCFSQSKCNLLKSKPIPSPQAPLADLRREIDTKTPEKEKESHMETSLECSEANSPTFNLISQQLQNHSNKKLSLTANENEEIDHSEEKSSSCSTQMKCNSLNSKSIPSPQAPLAHLRREMDNKTPEKEKESRMETSLECSEANSPTFNCILQQLQTYSNEKLSLTTNGKNLIPQESLADTRSDIDTKTPEKEEVSRMETSLECSEANSTTFDHISQHLPNYSTTNGNEEIDNIEEETSSCYSDMTYNLLKSELIPIPQELNDIKNDTCSESDDEEEIQESNYKYNEDDEKKIDESEFKKILKNSYEANSDSINIGDISAGTKNNFVESEILSASNNTSALENSCGTENDIVESESSSTSIITPFETKNNLVNLKRSGTSTTVQNSSETKNNLVKSKMSSTSNDTSATLEKSTRTQNILLNSEFPSASNDVCETESNLWNSQFTSTPKKTQENGNNSSKSEYTNILSKSSEHMENSAESKTRFVKSKCDITPKVSSEPKGPLLKSESANNSHNLPKSLKKSTEQNYNLFEFDETSNPQELQCPKERNSSSVLKKDKEKVTSNKILSVANCGTPNSINESFQMEEDTTDTALDTEDESIKQAQRSKKRKYVKSNSGKKVIKMTKTNPNELNVINESNYMETASKPTENSTETEKTSLKPKVSLRLPKRKRPPTGTLMAKSLKIYKLKNSAITVNPVEQDSSLKSDANVSVPSNKSVDSDQHNSLCETTQVTKKRKTSTTNQENTVPSNDSKPSQSSHNNSAMTNNLQNNSYNRNEHSTVIAENLDSCSNIPSKRIRKTRKCLETSATTPKVETNKNISNQRKIIPSQLESSKINIIQDIILKTKNKNCEQKTGGFKRPLVSKIIPACPQSPPPQTQEECENSSEPLIIPLDKPEKMNPDKAGSLFRKLITYSTEEKTVEEVARQFCSQEVDYISSLILEQIVQDKEKPDAQVARAPLMTHTQRVMLGFMLKLEKMNVSNLIDTYLKTSELYLMKAEALEQVESSTRLYVAICKSHGYIERIRRFCLDAFYFMGDLAIPFFFTVLISWIEVLPPSKDSEKFPLVKVLVQLINLKTCNKPGYNLLKLRELLHKFYEYPSEYTKSDDFFQQLFTNYLKNPVAPSDFAILLYCKNNECKWVCQKIDTLIKPILPNLKNDNFKATLIILIGNIVNQFNGKLNFEYVKPMREWLKEMIKEEDIPEIVMRSIMYAINKLPKGPKNPKNKNVIKENV